MTLTLTQKLLFTQWWKDLCAQEAFANLEKQPNDSLHGAGLPQLLGWSLLDDARLQVRLHSDFAFDCLISLSSHG